MAATLGTDARLTAVRAAIAAAARAAGRDPADVALVAVSKSQPASAIREAWSAGQRAFGENYPQELAAKAAELADLGLEWHFIGQLQSNKTRPVAELAAWVHGLDRLRIAERLSAQRPAHLPPLKVCLQVDVSGEPGKGGVAPAELPALARAVARLPRLELVGLMCIPEPAGARADRRAPFRRLRELAAALRAEGLALSELSMGMSDDFTDAIAEGATRVRVGSAVFGARG
jgi:pyridoxal phosphate enzyme (YggS family)